MCIRDRPSGILRETTVNVMGNGMVIDLEHLVHEIENPVSYTHLDVYKRQAISSMVSASMCSALV